MKYVIFENEYSTDVRIFPSSRSHSEVVEELKSSSPGLKPVSAGTITLTENGEVRCWGESTQLGLKARRHEDRGWIESAFRAY